MSAGSRNERVGIYTRSNVSATGDAQTVFTRVNSGDVVDQKWWASKHPVSARQAYVAMQQTGEVTWAFAFHEEVRLNLSHDGALEHEGKMFGIIAVLPVERTFGEVVVHAVEITDEVFEVVNP